MLAAAGLERLRFFLRRDGRLLDDPRFPRVADAQTSVPPGLFATPLEPEEMLPCVGQAAIGLEIRENDERLEKICAKLNHFNTRQCVTAERTFLKAMGGGCQLAVAAYAEVLGHQIRMRAVSFLGDQPRRAEARRAVSEAAQLGEQLATELGGKSNP